jgi:D-3-phosphoglycerate dehydrogenase
MPVSFQKLITMPNVLLSPHIAGWTHESNIKMAQVLFDKIRALKI